MKFSLNVIRSIKYIALIICICCLCGCFRDTLPAPIDVNAGTAMIIGAASGETLFEKHADRRFPPASTAKVMTAIIALEHLDLDEEIIAGKKAVRVEPVVAGLVPGVKYGLRDLLAAILIRSGNDAAVVIAEGCAGSEKEFARMMNEKAKEIGMVNTYFANASGLPTGKRDRQYTTAEDLCVMMRYAARYKIIMKTMSRKEAVIHGSDGSSIHLATHNRTLLCDGETVWGKTGYTKEAKRTFVGMDPCFNPKIIFALLQSTRLFYDIGVLKQRGMDLYRRRYGTVFSRTVDWIRRKRMFGGSNIAVTAGKV